MESKLVIYGVVLLLGTVIGASATWYVASDFINKAEIKAEQKFNTLLEQEKSKYSIKIMDLESTQEELKLLASSTQNEIDSLNSAISTRTKELNRLKKDYNDKVSKINGMSHNELTTFFSNRYGY